MADHNPRAGGVTTTPLRILATVALALSMIAGACGAGSDSANSQTTPSDTGVAASDGGDRSAGGEACALISSSTVEALIGTAVPGEKAGELNPQWTDNCNWNTPVVDEGFYQISLLEYPAGWISETNALLGSEPSPLAGQEGAFLLEMIPGLSELQLSRSDHDYVVTVGPFQFPDGTPADEWAEIFRQIIADIDSNR